MSIRIALAALAVAFVAACQPQQPAPVAQPVVVAPEPTFSGKY